MEVLLTLDQNLCEKACLDCALACDQLVIHANEKFPEKQNLISLCLDCADISRLTNKMILRNSIFAKDLAKECVKICDEIISIEGPDDDVLKNCKEACAACGDKCMEFISTGVL